MLSQLLVSPHFDLGQVSSGVMGRVYKGRLKQANLISILFLGREEYSPLAFVLSVRRIHMHNVDIYVKTKHASVSSKYMALLQRGA